MLDKQSYAYSSSLLKSLNLPERIYAPVALQPWAKRYLYTYSSAYERSLSPVMKNEIISFGGTLHDDTTEQFLQ